MSAGRRISFRSSARSSAVIAGQFSGRARIYFPGGRGTAAELLCEHRIHRMGTDYTENAELLLIVF